MKDQGPQVVDAHTVLCMCRPRYGLGDVPEGLRVCQWLLLGALMTCRYDGDAMAMGCCFMMVDVMADVVAWLVACAVSSPHPESRRQFGP